MTLKARVQGGRLVVNEPTDLPEGTEVPLLSLDPGDWLDDDDRAALHRALEASEEDVARNDLVDADAVLAYRLAVARPDGRVDLVIRRCALASGLRGDYSRGLSTAPDHGIDTPVRTGHGEAIRFNA
jgi:hypothetical protein